VRDLDVMLEQAADNPSLAEELKKQRDKALKPLAKLHKRLLKSQEFDKRQRRLLRDIDQPRKRLGEWGAKRAGKQAAALAALGEGSLKALAAAHEFRIACKELRYVLEIIGCGLPNAAVKLYEMLGDLQRLIGVVCDHAAAERMYQALLTKVSPSQRQPLRAAIATARQEKNRRHRVFLRWWRPRTRKAFQQALTHAGLL
jgi:CHAD domain-containing protein